MLDDDPSIFHEFMCLLYPTGKLIRLSKIDKLLELADRVLCPYVTAICQQRLISLDANSISPEEKMKIADKYNLIELKARIMQRISKQSLESLSKQVHLFKNADTVKMIFRRYQLMHDEEDDFNSSEIVSKNFRKRRY